LGTRYRMTPSDLLGLYPDTLDPMRYPDDPPEKVLEDPEACSDTLFLFLVRELCEEDLTNEERFDRVSNAIADLECVSKNLVHLIKGEIRGS
jgi:hypothetical protein